MNAPEADDLVVLPAHKVDKLLHEHDTRTLWPAELGGTWRWLAQTAQFLHARAMKMHRRAQQAEGAVLRRRYELETMEMLYQGEFKFSSRLIKERDRFRDAVAEITALEIGGIGARCRFCCGETHEYSPLAGRGDYAEWAAAFPHANDCVWVEATNVRKAANPAPVDPKVSDATQA